MYAMLYSKLKEAGIGSGPSEMEIDSLENHFTLLRTSPSHHLSLKHFDRILTMGPSSHLQSVSFSGLYLIKYLSILKVDYKLLCHSNVVWQFFLRLLHLHVVYYRTLLLVFLITVRCCWCYTQFD